MSLYDIISKITIAEQVQIDILMLVCGVLCIWYGVSVLAGKMVATIMLSMFAGGVYLFLTFGNAVLEPVEELRKLCLEEEMCPLPGNRSSFFDEIVTK